MIYFIATKWLCPNFWASRWMKATTRGRRDAWRPSVKPTGPPRCPATCWRCPSEPENVAPGCHDLDDLGMVAIIGFKMFNPRQKRTWVITINVNPGLINHGLWIGGGTPPIVIIWYLNGTLPIKQPRGLLIQGWHYGCLVIFFMIMNGVKNRKNNP